MTQTQTQIRYTEPIDPSDLYLHYDGQSSPQRVYLWLDEDGKAGWDVDGEIGSSIPSYVYHGLTLRWYIRGCPTLDAIESIMEEVLPLLDQVHAGHDVEWDGSNTSGRLIPVAQAASDQIEQILAADDGDRYCEVDAAEWCQEISSEVKNTIRAGKDNAQISDAYFLNTLQDGDDCEYRITDVEEWIEGLRREVAAEDEDEDEDEDEN